jgi:hypothetical protein
MGRAGMQSYRLCRPPCPRCHSQRTRIDWARVGNLWRLPTEFVSGVLFYPVVGLPMRCRDCGRRSLRRGTLRRPSAGRTNADPAAAKGGSGDL